MRLKMQGKEMQGSKRVRERKNGGTIEWTTVNGVNGYRSLPKELLCHPRGEKLPEKETLTSRLSGWRLNTDNTVASARASSFLSRWTRYIIRVPWSIRIKIDTILKISRFQIFIRECKILKIQYKIYTTKIVVELLNF